MSKIEWTDKTSRRGVSAPITVIIQCGKLFSKSLANNIYFRRFYFMTWRNAGINRKGTHNPGVILFNSKIREQFLAQELSGFSRNSIQVLCFQYRFISMSIVSFLRRMYFLSTSFFSKPSKHTFGCHKNTDCWIPCMPNVSTVYRPFSINQTGYICRFHFRQLCNWVGWFVFFMLLFKPNITRSVIIGFCRKLCFSIHNKIPFNDVCFI